MKKEKITFTIKPNYKTKVENIYEQIQEIKRGTGITRPKKGRGSYTRKIKHKKKLFEY